MKRQKPITAVILSFVLIVSAILGQFPANTRVKAETEGYGISNPCIDSNGVTTWDCIWFGNYWQSNGETKEPIKWRVLSVDGDDAFLLADKNLDCQPYNTESKSVTWENCTLRTWLNSTFYQNAFSEAEQAAVRTTAVVNEDNPFYGSEGGNNTQDKVYLLSIEEAGNAAYEFDGKSETRHAKNTEYAKKQGAFTNTSGNGYWWLRSPSRFVHYAAVVDGGGYAYPYGIDVLDSFIGVRPALHINLSSTVWKKADKMNSLATQSSIPTKYGISNPVIKDGVTTWDCIWFGNYWQSDGKKKEPIKWRVLSVDGDDAFLLADKNLDCQPYNTEYKSVTWENCTLRTWLNSTFYQNAFSEAEQAAVRTTAVVNEDNPFYGSEGGNNTQDKVYLLSIEEAGNAAYGFHSTYKRKSETRHAKNTEYARKQGAFIDASGNGHWWLRSPGCSDRGAAYVDSDGYASPSGYSVDSSNLGVRPALHINLSSTVWKKADKVNSWGSTPTKYGISNPVRKIQDRVTTWDCIWFGNYWQSDGETKEPIKWRVLSVDGDDAFLLADKNLDCQPYNTEYKSVTWGICTLRTWLNSTFYQNAFSEAEQAAVRTTAVVNEDNPSNGREGGNNTQDKVYLLSIAEAGNAAYGFDGISKTRHAKNTEYAKKQDALTNTSGKGYWWLRSPGNSDYTAAFVDGDGYAHPNDGAHLTGDYVHCRYIGVRPVLHINLSSTVWKKAGKVNSLGYVIEAETPTSPPPETAKPTPQQTAEPTQIPTVTPVLQQTAKPTPQQTAKPTQIPTATPSLQQTAKPTPTQSSAPTKYGISNPVRKIQGGVTAWDCIWFGNYWQSDGKKKEPIKWRVLSVDGDDAFLLADKNLDCQPYNTENKSVTWETCTLRTWLNSTFCQNAFSEAEQAAVRTTAVVNKDNPFYGTEGGNNTQDKVYLLSIAEASNAVYGFDSRLNRESETRHAKNTEYAKKQGALTTVFSGKGYWWLRSPGYDDDYAACVTYDGVVGSNGESVRINSDAVRPVLHINLSSNTWSKAGTVSSSGDIEEIPAPTPTQVPIRKAETPTDDQDQSQAVMSDSTQGSIPAGTKIKDTAGVTYTVTSSGSSKSEAAYTAPKNKKVTSVAIPATVKLNGTTYKVTSIKANTFKKCKKLKKVTIGKNIKAIGKNAFYQCTKLKNITIKTTKLTKKNVGSKAFAKLNIKVKIKVPKKKLSAYKKILKKKGVTGKKQVIKKLYD